MNRATPFPWPADSPDTGRSTRADTGSLLLFRDAPLAIAQCDASGVITAANLAFERLFGIRAGSSSAAPLGGHIQLGDLVQPGEREEMECLLREMIAGRREGFQIENQLEHENPGTRGSEIWARWTVWRDTSSGEKPAGAVAMAEDATANHYSSRRLRQVGRLEALGRLASGVAHDFNNLLTGVTLYSDLLIAGLEAAGMDQGSGVRGQGLGDCESDHRLRKYAKEIRGAAVHASGLVRQLLAVARAPNEAPHLQSLNAIAEGMRQLLLRLMGENVELVYQLDPNLGAVRMDATEAQQILMNLVLNARDAMPEGGRITVETRNCGLQIVSSGLVEKTGQVELPCALFVVSDNGQGMDSQTQQHVFEAFFSTKPPGEGTGLGLSTVCDIVTNNGGLIHIDSERKRGTRVTVLLPLIPLAATSWPPSSLPVPSARSHFCSHSLSHPHSHSLAISPAELPNVAPGNSQPPNDEGVLPFPEEEPKP